MNTLASVMAFTPTFKNISYVIPSNLIFGKLVVNDSTANLVIGSQLSDTNTTSKKYTFTGQTGDTGTIDLVDSKYALNLSGGTLMFDTVWSLSTTGITFMSWVRLTSSQPYHTVCGFGAVNSPTGCIFMIYERYLVCTPNINTFSNESGMGLLDLNRWYHVCCVVTSGTSKQYYVNGIKVGAAYTSNVITTNDANQFTVSNLKYFVGWYSPTQYSTTRNDDMFKNRIVCVKSTLTDSQVKSIYDAELNLS